MQPIPFTAASAEEALTQIRAKLGPEAVVLNVRRLPQNGFARLWQKPMIEVLAYRARSTRPETAPISETLAEFRQQFYEIKQQVEADRPAQRVGMLMRLTDQADVLRRPPKIDERNLSRPNFVTGRRALNLNCGNWRIGAVLRKSGLQPLHAQQVLDRLHAQYGENPPASLGEEIRLAQAVLAIVWRSPAALKDKLVARVGGPRRFRQDDLLVQMAHANGSGARASGAGLAAGWRDGEHGRILERLLRDFGRSQRAGLGANGNQSC